MSLFLTLVSGDGENLKTGDPRQSSRSATNARLSPKSSSLWKEVWRSKLRRGKSKMMMGKFDGFESEEEAGGVAADFKGQFSL